jgi:(p)ppGpp synthase/HD superfamily hydrolase
MARRLADEAREAGVPGAGARRVAVAFQLAMARRAALLPEHDPDYLHTGRTVLILLRDAASRDDILLAAGALLDSLRPELAPTPAEVEAAVGAEVAALLARVPTPAAAGDALLEELLAADEAVRTLALSERLDHARHLHLRPVGEREEAYRETCESYAPIAGRTHAVLERRYRWWCGMFAARYLGSGSGSA